METATWEDAFKREARFAERLLHELEKHDPEKAADLRTNHRRMTPEGELARIGTGKEARLEQSGD